MPVRAVHATSSSSAGSRSTSPARCRRRRRSTAFLGRQGPEQARQAGRRPAGDAGVQLLLRQQVGRRPARQARGSQPDRAYGTFAFHDWIREAIAADKPYDEFARDILAATGDETTSPPTVWYKELQTPEQFVDDTAQVFLGLRMACAQCHHHPYEKWSQDDYWGLAAFFGRVGRKNVPVPGEVARTSRASARSSSPRRTGSVTNKRTGQPAVMKPLDGEPVKVGRDDDPRQKLVDWMVDAKNPFFARAVANRYWAHFFGRGIVDPLDDMRVTNPPSQPRAARRPGQGPGRAQVQPQAPDRDDLQEPDLSAQRRRPTSSTSTTSRPTPATIRGA